VTPARGRRSVLAVAPHQNMCTHDYHDHDHGEETGPHAYLTSIGVDIGSSTSHLVLPPRENSYRRPPRCAFSEQNIGSVVGNALSKNWLMPCIDEFTVSEVEFVDLGEIVPGQGFMPVVVKSLPFGA